MMFPEPELSADEFKNRIYSKLKEKGHVDALKAQLRCRLVEELQKSRLSLPLQPKYVGDEEPLLYRAANSLVADHLKRCNYDYALSVFLPESGTAHDKIFPVRDLLQLLHINPQSKLYKRLTERIPDYNKKGFLWQLLSEIANEHGYSDRDHGAQTDTIPLHPISSLDDKLTEVDRLYSARKEEVHHSGRIATEERILSYQKQVEDRSNMHIKMEISRFKENELARQKVEEREKCRKELEDLRREMERAYQAKVSSLVERERNAIERLQKQQEGQEKEVYIQRQSILDEIETVHQRDVHNKKEMQVNDRERKLNEDKYRAMDELLRKRENTVKRSEDSFEKKLNEEMTRFRLDEQAKYVHRLKELEVREARNQEDLKIISAEKESLKSMREELREKRIQVNELESQYQQSRIDVISMSKQNEVLHEKVREMVDYKYIKEENAVLKKELETVKSHGTPRGRLAEVNMENERERRKQDDLVREMVDRSGKPNPEALLMHHEAEKARDAVKHEQIMSEYVHREMEQRLQQEVGSSKQIMKRFEEQTMQQRQMNREIMDLKHQLIQTQHALNNAARNPVRHRGMSMSEEESDMSYNDRPTSPDDYYDTTLGKSSPEPELMLLGERFKRRGHAVGDNDDDDFIHGMKSRLKDLEREAETLEASYHSFQARMSNLHIGWPMESVRTTASKYKVVFADSVANSLGNNPNYASHALRTPPSRSPVGGYQSPRSPRQHPPVPTPRPLSSTPYKHPEAAHHDHSTSTRLEDSRPSARSNLLPSFGLSTVTHSNEQTVMTVQDATPKPLPVPHKRKTMTVDDLDARPGSPSIVVVPGSQTTETYSSQPTNSSQPESVAAPNRDVSLTDFKYSPARDSLMKTPDHMQSTVPETPPSSLQLPSLEDAWKSQPAPMAVSLDDTWKQETEHEKQRHQSEEKRRHDEEEEAKWEEQRRQREEWRRKRDEEQRERERQVLESLVQAEQSKKKSELPPLKKSPVAKSPEPLAEPNNNEDKIDPVMQKYMEMVQQQKEKEKKSSPVVGNSEETAQKKVGTKKKDVVHETTPSVSEHELSVADDESKGPGAADSDGFEW